MSDLNEVDQMICSKLKTDLAKKEKLISEDDNLQLNPLRKRNCSDCRRKSKNTANPVFPANLMLKRRLKDSAKTSATANL